MLVPQTAVNENNGPILRENKIRAPWQRPYMKAIPKTQCKQPLADDVLRLRVLSTDSGHAVAALFG